MPTALRRLKRNLRRSLKRASDTVAGSFAVAMLNILRLGNPDTTANALGFLMRKIGPLLPEHKIGRGNLAAAFPEKSAAEIETILGGVWDNLGRIAGEFAHLDRLWDYDPQRPAQHGRIVVAQRDIEIFNKLAESGKPTLVFAAHLANWELPAICATTFKLDSALLYRRPNIPAIDRWLRESRAVNMGELIPTGLDAPVRLANALKRGAHVGMLVDQYFTRGVDVTFFGRRTRANPLLARLAQHFDCPIYGVRVIRLPGNRFTGELTEPISPVRDADGNVDVTATMQLITGVVEGWVREYPEQWLWLHRRWRPEDDERPNGGR